MSTGPTEVVLDSRKKVRIELFIRIAMATRPLALVITNPHPVMGTRDAPQVRHTTSEMLSRIAHATARNHRAHTRLRKDRGLPRVRTTATADRALLNQEKLLPAHTVVEDDQEVRTQSHSARVQGG